MKSQVSCLIVGGARPNFMKIAPVARAIDQDDRITYELAHTGQHYDKYMSDVFFQELGIPLPNYHLGVGSGSHAEQTARIMVEFEKVLQKADPDIVIVVGDVNSTLACSIVAKKANIAVAHIEAGLRSRDMEMPEEINRLVTDSISDFFFVTEKSGVDNLLAEGKKERDVYFVGHVMIDNLYYQLKALKGVENLNYADYKQRKAEYAVVTLHRPSNVDNPENFKRVMTALVEVSKDVPIFFPIHPRTRGRLEAFEIDVPPSITLAPPLSYMEFLNIWKDAKMVLTDSGGLQEETTALGVPCLTMRDNTERPITVSKGTNKLVGNSYESILSNAQIVMDGKWKKGESPELWDGKAAERIVEILRERMS